MENSMKNMKAKENHRSFLYIGKDYDPIKISYGNVKSTDTIIQPLNETITLTFMRKKFEHLLTKEAWIGVYDATKISDEKNNRFLHHAWDFELPP